MTKPGINALVLVTTLGGYALAVSGFRLDWVLSATLGGTALSVAGASLANHYMEKDVDAQMERTQDRPLPSGRVDPLHALILSLLLISLGVGILAFLANTLAAALALLAVVSYVPVYTYLKRVTSLATLFGAIPGALPPMIGWAAARGSVDPPALALFAILFLWQPPHFLALALMIKGEYQQAQLPMLPVEQDDEATVRQMVLYTSALLFVSLLPVALGTVGWLYGFGMLVLGLVFLLLVSWGLKSKEARENGWARGVFLYSILYLGILFLLIFLDPTEVINPWMRI